MLLDEEGKLGPGLAEELSEISQRIYGVAGELSGENSHDADSTERKEISIWIVSAPISLESRFVF